MVLPRELLSTIESTLLGPSPPSPAQRVELMLGIRSYVPHFRSLLSYPPPKQSDRVQVQSKEVRLPDSSPISLDDTDVQIALKLSHDLHLNEIECVRLLVSTNQELGLLGRDALEILRLAAGLWYTERRNLLTALYMLLRAIVLDQGLEADLVSDIQKCLEDLINAGLRQRILCVLKELSREEPAGLGGPLCEQHVLDAKNSLVERRAVVCRERLVLGHCLVLSILVVRTSPKEMKDTFDVLKDTVAELTEVNDPLKQQIVYSLFFSVVIAFISDALSAVPDKASILSHDASFRREFHELVMTAGNTPDAEGYMNGVRLAWAVHLMLVQDGVSAREAISSASSNALGYILPCLESIFSNNVFQFVLNNILRTAAYQNDDEDITYMYNAYLHKLITCFLSHPLAMEKVKEAKEKAMNSLNSYRLPPSHDSNSEFQQSSGTGPFPFVSLLEFVGEIYQKEPELIKGNDVLWMFVNFAGEDHNNVHTLVAFLNMLRAVASSQDGAAKVYELLQSKAFRSIGWNTLFECLTIYDEKFKQSLQAAGAMLPEFQEGDAKALVAYLNVLQQVMESGPSIDKNSWFPDIEPLFKLLGYENVPPYLKGALRNAITTFVKVLPVLKDPVWSYLEKYDLPVVIGPRSGSTAQPMVAQVYDMQYELNEVEARRERYPSTISFLKLLNALISMEKDVNDSGRRYVGIFRFIYDHVFGPFPQRAYADPCEKWELVVACLQNFHMMLSMYDIQDEDIDNGVDHPQHSTSTRSATLQMQLPVVELLKDFMSGKTVFRNIMGILLLGVNSLIAGRTTQIHGHLLEKAVQLSLEIMILVFQKDLLVSDYWRPLYQPLDVILSQDHSYIVTLLEYVRYDFLLQIQQCSIRIMSILSSRMVGLVQLLLKSNASSYLVEDYAACLELRSEEFQMMENSADDPVVLILQLLIENVGRPAPNITHLLLKFDLDTPVERTVLQPKYHYSCLKVILEVLDKNLKPDTNGLLIEFGFQLLYELCVDPLTCGPTMDLLSKKKYQFFAKHLDTLCVAPLPKRSSNQPFRISSLHQRAWLLKLLAVELHAGFLGSTSHREACQIILAHLFGGEITSVGFSRAVSEPFLLQSGSENTGTQTMSKSKVLELLEVLQFKSPDTMLKLPEVASNMKYGLLAEEILGDGAASGKGGIYFYSERGDRLIDLALLRDKLWQKFNTVAEFSNFSGEAELNDVREAVQCLLRWGWKYNKNLEEQAAQLHMLTGWSQIIEVSASRRIASLENRSEILYQVLDASLQASASPDCSLRMAFILTQAALTCMAKLRDERFLYPDGLFSDNITCLETIMAKQLPNGACHSILFKLILAILRNESSEALRRRQYALLLSYFQYCRHTLDPDVPSAVLQFLLQTDHDSEDLDLHKMDREQAELARANFSILRKEAQAILDLVIKDATLGSEPGKTVALYVLDALISIDHDRYFLTQLQSRGFLRSCFVSISNPSYQDGGHSVGSLQRTCTLEAAFALILRISYKYGKSGAQVLFSMGAVEHIGSCRAVNLQGSLRRFDPKLRRDVVVDVDRQRKIVTPVLRLVFSLTSLVDTSDIFEVKNKIVREVIDFVKGHQLLFDQIIRKDILEADELTMEQINLVVGMLTKVWPYEESDDFGFVQGLFCMIHVLFSHELETPVSGRFLQRPERRKLELSLFQLCFSLSSYLYFLVTKKSLRLQISDDASNFHSLAKLKQPTLSLVCSLLSSATNSLERASEERSLSLNKIRDINELSRQEVDEIIDLCVKKEYVTSSDNLQNRRYTAMVEMCQVAGNTDQLITLLLPLVEHILNIIVVHFQDSSWTPDISGTTEMITHDSSFHPGHDLSLMCEKLVPTLERLELLSEEKVGRNLKVFRRLVTSIKEMAIQKLTS